MNIGIYGNSICDWDGKEEFSFVKKLKDYFDANIVNTGCVMCSEERMLYQIKKTKNLDLAIVIHTKPENIFVPTWDRDIDSLNREYLVKKMKDGKHCIVPNFDETIDTVRASDFEAIESFYTDAIGGEHANNEEFLTALLLNKKYLFDVDLQRSRYYGALIQIDQYLTAMNIPVVHCLGKPDWIPSWFKFSSGETEKTIQTFRYDPRYTVSYQESSNALNEEGNNAVFEILLPLINAARSKVVIR
jgi:hypothetical protein